MADEKTDNSNPKRRTQSATDALTFDAQEFMAFLDGVDWAEKEKHEYLALVWSIVCEFVALGWDVHPINQAQQNCGKTSKQAAQPPQNDSAMVHSSHTKMIEEFVHQNGTDNRSGKKEVADV